MEPQYGKTNYLAQKYPQFMVETHNNFNTGKHTATKTVSCYFDNGLSLQRHKS
jgi:hypothetical protein